MVSVFWLWGVWDLSSLTRDWTYTLCIGRRSLNDWAVRKSQDAGFFPGLRSLIRRLNSTACKIPYSFPIACGIWKPFTFTWNLEWWMWQSHQCNASGRWMFYSPTSSQLDHLQACPLLSNVLQTPAKRPFLYLVFLLVTNQCLSVVFPPNKRSTPAFPFFQHCPQSLAIITSSRYHSSHPKSSAFS